MSMPNGHAAVLESDGREPSAQPLRSESELSDLNDAPPPRSPPQDETHSDDDAIHDMATSEMEDDEDAPGEDDAEYEAASPQPETTGGMRHDRSSSEEDVRSGKRKSEVDDEQYMKQNPELYGLRRSVSASNPTSVLTRMSTYTLLLGPSKTKSPSGTCTCLETQLIWC